VKALVQTVSRASVTVDGVVVGAIADGLLVLVGVTHSDTEAVARELARKVYELRILDDERSAADITAPVLVVSQFTVTSEGTLVSPPLAVHRYQQTVPVLPGAQVRAGAGWTFHSHLPSWAWSSGRLHVRSSLAASGLRPLRYLWCCPR
jgi:hypothetical protein